MRFTTSAIPGLILLSGTALLATPSEPLADRALESGLETMISPDIRLVDALLTFQGAEGHWKYRGTLSTGQIALDYVSAEVDRFSIFHKAERLLENRVSGELSLSNHGAA